METVITVGITVVVILIALLIVIVPTVMIFNVQAGVKYRKDLAEKLDHLRMAKMLKALNIDIVQYLHEEPIIDIKKHMSQCADCQNTDQCDEELSAENVDVNDISYCNNEKSLQDIAAKK